MRQEQRILLNHEDLNNFVNGKAIRLDGPGGSLLVLVFDEDGIKPVIATNGHNISPRGTSPKTGLPYKRGPYKPYKKRRRTTPASTNGNNGWHAPDTYGPNKRLLPVGFRCKRGCNKSFAGKSGAIYATHVKLEHPQKKGR